MTCFLQHGSARARGAGGGAARRLVLCACAFVLSIFVGSASPCSAQSPTLNAPVRDTSRSRDVIDFRESSLRTAQKPVTKPATPPQSSQQTAPATRKTTSPATSSQKSSAQRSGSSTTRPRQSPAARTTQPAPPNAEVLPPPTKATVPLVGSNPIDDGIQLTQQSNGLITLIVRDKSLSQVLALIAQTQKLNIVAANDIDALISITLRDVPIEDALTAILSVANYTWVKRNDIILITSLTEASNLPADVQGRQIHVYDLDFASATLVSETVKNFLSPIGKVSIGASSPTNNRLTQERIVVEDVPESIARISDYIAQVDQPPRQVLIEAHVLDIKLNDTNNCGVNLSALGLNGNFGIEVARLATNGWATPGADGFVATLGSADLGAVIEILQKTTDAKSLGSPKLIVLNEQEARIQVGETLYFKQVTTTETSSQQGAGSVEAGTILRITPRITRDQRVLLKVAPEISTPQGTGTDGLPPNILKTTLETDVLLHDNEGMVIGGLIQEKDSTEQSKIPYLGNMKGIGFLFRRSEVIKERHEIIVALVPRIQPYDQQYHDYEQGELVKAGVPLFHGPLCRTDRPWDAVLPDGKRVAYPIIPKKKSKLPPSGYYHELPPYEIPPTPLPRQQMSQAGCAPGEESPNSEPDLPAVEPENVEQLPIPVTRDMHEGAVICDQ